MLVLSRKVCQTIVVGGDVRITIVAVRGQQVRIGIEAPGTVPVLRGELLAAPGGAGRSGPAARSAERAQELARNGSERGA